jgi:beta-glucosidase
MVVPVIRGINKNVMSISKHYILNNQETHRSGVNELVDSTTLMELYGPPFAAAAQHTSGIMCAYNRVNGTYACENELTLSTMLKGWYNFSGFVVSDWGATHSTIPSLINGLDIEMPKANYYAPDKVQAAIDAGNITKNRVEDVCVRVITGWFNVPENKRYPCRNSEGSSICIQANVSTNDHKNLARRISALSTVLLQNDDDLLPLNPKPTSKTIIALIGPDATTGCYTGGGGSGHVNTNAQVCPVQAFSEIAKASGGNATPSCTSIEGRIIGRGYFETSQVSNVEECCNACSASSKCVAFTYEKRGTCYLKDNAEDEGARSTATSGKISQNTLLQFIYEEGKTIDSAAAAAKAADVAIVFGSAHTSEGADRANLSLGGNIDDVISAVAAVNKKTIVVLSVPGSILTPWRSEVAAILVNGLPGEQVGPALGDIIFGKIPPQARLPVTFPNKENEQNMTIEQYPGIKTSNFTLECVYSEGQINGYRWYDKHNVKPAFAFGAGLTYGGAFQYSNITIKNRTITFSVKRNGATAAGCDTPQVYFSYPYSDTNDRIPQKVLRYFVKVCDDNTSSDGTFKTKVNYTFGDKDISNWNDEASKWVVTKGDYKVSVGSSASDIQLTASFKV